MLVRLIDLLEWLGLACFVCLFACALDGLLACLLSFVLVSLFCLFLSVCWLQRLQTLIDSCPTASKASRPAAMAGSGILAQLEVFQGGSWWMDGWVDGWVDGWMDGWMGGWVLRRFSKFIYP